MLNLMQTLSEPILELVILHTKILLLVPAIYLALKLFRSAAAWRHAVWFFIFMIILFLPLLAMWTPHWHIPVLKIETSEKSGEPHQPLVNIEPVEGRISHAKAALNPPETPAAAQSFSVRIQPVSSQTLLTIFWFAGFLLFQIRYIIGQFQLFKLIKSSTLATDSSISQLRKKVKDRLSLSGRIQILVSDELQTPLATGFFRHNILLPSAWTTWNRDHLEYVLLHEAAHMKRRDMLTQFIVHIIAGLFWFNPAVWFAQKQFVIEREHACDDLVVAHSNNPQRYADMLLEFAQKSFAMPRAAYAGLSMARSSQLEGRLLSILKSKKQRASTLNLIRTALVCIIIIFPILCLSPFAIGNETSTIDTTHTALVIESLKYALNDDDDGVRRKAVRTLGKINSPKSTELLLQALQRANNDWAVELNAAKILLQRGEISALGKFIAGLSDEDAKTRKRSAKILRELKHPASLQALVKAINEQDDKVRKEIIHALCELRIDGALEPLRQAAKDEDADIRRIAVWGLGEMENPKTLKYLYDALDDLDAKVRCNAIESIGDLKQSDSAVHIAPLLNDREWFVRREAIRVLAELKATWFVPGVINALQDDNRNVRQAAADALGQLGDRRAIVPLSAALHDKSDDVREEAADALGEFYKEK